MAIIRQSNTVELDVGWTAANGDTWIAQTFTTINAYTLTSLKIFGWRDGTPGTVTVSIRAVDGAGEPLLPELSTGTFDADAAVGTTFATAAWASVTMTAVDLTADTQYAIVVRALTGDGGNQFKWEENSGEYAGGSRYRSWTAGIADSWAGLAGAAYDFGFVTYSSGVVDLNQKVKKQIVCASLGEMWYGTTAEALTQLAASVGDIDAETYPLSIFELYEKVFIANGPNLKVMDFGNHKLQTDDIKDTVAGATSYPLHGTTITGAGGAKMVVDYITALDDGAYIYGKKINSTAFIAGELVSGTNSDDTTVKFDIKAGTTEVAPTTPHWYNWTVYGGSTAFGVMPTYAVLGCNYRGRASLSGNQGKEHQWYHSRQKNPWDWLYGKNDAQSAVAGNDADAGEIGDVVISQIPYKDDFEIFGCANTLWVMAGDAAEGGTINELDLTTGMLGSEASCWDNADNLYIMSTKGLLLIPPGFGTPVSLTEEIYPDFVKDLAYDPSLHRLTMEFDRLRNGILIAKTTTATGGNSCWWYSLRTGGLFPESYPTQCGPFSLFWYEAMDPDYRGLLFGCNDGYTRYHDDSSIDDNIGATDEAVTSYVTLGPIKLGGENREGKITSMVGVTTGGSSGGSENDSSDVAYKIFVDRTADGILEKLSADSAPTVTGTISAPGRPRGSKKKQPIKGVWAGIRLENSTLAETWGFDTLILGVKDAGRIK